MKKKLKEEIKSEIECFFEKMGFEVKFEEIKLKENFLKISLLSKEENISMGGEFLFLLQALLKKILAKKFFFSKKFYLDLDLNHLKEKKIKYLKDLANSLADEVAVTQEERELLPMSPYERRIIHLEISKRKDVISYSIGREPKRRVIIKPSKGSQAEF